MSHILPIEQHYRSLFRQMNAVGWSLNAKILEYIFIDLKPREITYLVGSVHPSVCPSFRPSVYTLTISRRCLSVCRIITQMLSIGFYCEIGSTKGNQNSKFICYIHCQSVIEKCFLLQHYLFIEKIMPCLPRKI